MSELDDKKVYYLNAQNRRHVFTEMWETVPEGWKITIQPPGRTLDQNAKLWPMLDDVAKQVEWYGQYLLRDDWKDIFTAALKKAKVVPGLDGGFVVCGLHTSKMNKHDFSDLIELIYVFGCDPKHPVVWSEKAQLAYTEFKALPTRGQKALPK